MSAGDHRILLLSLGNDILGDDGIGLAAARILRERCDGGVDFVETAGSGLDLLDIVEGYDRALILDAISTGLYPTGTILELSLEDFQKMVGPSPHYAGLPETVKLAEQLGIPFPREVTLLAMEVENSYQFREGLSLTAAGALTELVTRAGKVLKDWTKEDIRTNTP